MEVLPYNLPIKRNYAWGGDEHTGGKPVSGRRIEEWIKSQLGLTIGYIFNDDENGRLLAFHTREEYEEYLETGDTSLIVTTYEFPDNSLFVGPEPPDKNTLLWLDTNNDYLSPTSLYMYSIQKAIRTLLELVDVLMGIRVRGAISGKISDGTRTLIARSTVPIMPDKIITNFYEQYQDGFIDEEDYYSTFEEDVNSGYIDQEVLDKYYHKGYISQEKYIEFSDILDSLNENGVQPNYEEGLEPTVSHISIKMGTWEQLLGNLLNFINGELLWCTGNTEDTLHNNKLYIHNNGVLYAIGSGGSINGGGSSEGEDTMDKQLVKELIGSELQHVESIGFVPVGSDQAKYTAKVNNEGTLIVYENELDNLEPEPTSNYYYTGSVAETGLVINSFYLGGDYDEHSYLGCSHNFVEISNVWVDKKTAKPKDINLNGFYLLYLGKGEAKWQVLPLWGKIPGGGTFLIRGAQCSVMDANTTKIKVKTYDMLWYVTKLDSDLNEYLEPIRFSQEGTVFYLCWSPQPNKFYELGSDTLVDLDLFSTTTNLVNVDAGTCAKGYIDLASFNFDNIFEKKTYTLANGKLAKDVIFRRWYMLDPVTLSNPKEGITKHNNVKYLTSSFLNESNVNNNIVEFTPKASFEHKSIKNTRSLFKEDKPSTLTCTFGILATDNYIYYTLQEASDYNTEHSLLEGDVGFKTTSSIKSGTGATRGFCWNSVGYFDEYLMFRKKGSSTWIKVESVKEELDPQTYINNLPSGVTVPSCISNYYNYFTRQRWESAYGLSITTHKVLITGLVDDNPSLNSGTIYEYKVVRNNGIAYKEGYQINEDSYTYESDIREFTVKADSKVSSFNFVLVTDLQGANWEEYEVWNLSARIIANEEKKYKEGWTEISDGNTTIQHEPHTSGIPEYDFIINTGDICYNGSRSNEWIDYYDGYTPLNNKEEMLTIGNNDLAPISMRDIGNGKESPWKINVNVGDYFYCVEIDSNNPLVFSGISAKDRTEILYKIPSLYSFNYGQFHFISLLSEIRTISNKVEDGEVSYLSQSTVNSIFGIVDELRNSSNLNASKIYDIEEEWIIKDLLLWKGLTIPSEFDRDAQRYNVNLINNCSKCIFFIHEMPFNIISESVYTAYTSGNTVPRETAKAYLNRYHNYEFLRLFKLWGVRLAMGGHKHTVALTGPVYDAPPGYNPITKQIVGNGVSHHATDDILNDAFDSEHTTGMFDPVSSVRPFLLVTTLLFNSSDIGENFRWESLLSVCAEVYNNTSSTTITINEQNIAPGNSITTSVSKPKIRLEIVDNINAPLYVMCQATGFKNKSNSELAAASGIPWEDFFVQSNHVKDLCYPFFTHYSVSSNQIDTKMYKIVGLYSPGKDGEDEGSKAGYWDLNKIYTHGDTLEENRNYFETSCKIELYNNNGTTENPEGSIISLS